MSIPRGYRRSVDLRLLRYFVAVAEERHVGRAADRLSMTQPPLSRAIRRLEDELGAQLLERTPKGVELTAAGTILYDEATALLEHADRLQRRVTAAAGIAVIAVGTLADAAEQVGATLVAAFRRQQPNVDVVIHEADLSDPTAGLRAGLVDVALTRAPFDAKGISSYVLRSDPIGVVLHDDDPLAGRESVALSELMGRRWVRLPDGTDATFRAYWTVAVPQSDELPVMKTIQECLQSVLWNGTSALAPLNQSLPQGLLLVPISDRAPSQLVVAWRGTDPSPLVRSFVEIAAASYRTP
jgi:DNA-binding transcriptional LysR family regulator